MTNTLEILEVPSLDFKRVERTEDNYIRTFTGRKFWPLNPAADEIFIEDIAHHLAMECRFNGATRHHYSVADHSLRVSRLVEQMALKAGREAARVATRSWVFFAREMALWGLLHDASEAYLKDMTRPVEHSPEFRIYRAIEHTLMQEVIARFDLTPHEPSIVKEADDILCNTEKRDLMHGASWDSGILPETIIPLGQEEAEAEFLRRFRALTMARKAEHAVQEFEPA